METKREKVHTQYKLADGKRVPGVTTILGILDKPALLAWAHRCGLEGIDYRKFRDNLADIGTLAHYLIMCSLSGQEPDTSEYSANDIDKAENCLLSYYEWEKGHTLKPLVIEQPLVSEMYKFGGTIDCYCELDGQPTLLDFKTGKGIYPEFFYQLAAYRQLLVEQGAVVEQARILRIGRDEDEGFEERAISNLNKHWQVFWNCLNIYELQKQIRRE